MANVRKIPTNGQKGKVIYNRGIVAGIVSLAISEINGVAVISKGQKVNVKNPGAKQGIKIKFDKNDKANIDVSIKVFYGYSVPDIAFKIQENIKHNLEAMTDFKSGVINVHVRGVIFSDETDEKESAI